MDLPIFRNDRVRACLAQTRTLSMEGDNNRLIGDAIIAEAVMILAQAGLDISDPDEGSHEEDILAAMIVAMNNGILAGYAYAKLPRRM